MPIPLAIAAPVAAGAFAYLNAKASLWYDWLLLKCLSLGGVRVVWRLRSDKLNLFYTLESWATRPKTADKPLILFEGKTFTYAQVYDKALRYGHWLRTNYGVKPKDIVAIDFQNCETFIFLWWALWSIGAKPAFINYNLTGKALTHCVKAANTKLCIVDPEVASNVTDEVRKSVPGVNFVAFTPEVEAAASASPPTRVPDSDRSENEIANMAMLIYTSGTTGLPKPAIVSWGKCIVGGTFGDRLLGRGNDIMYTSMPLYHSSAAVLSFVSTILSGSTQALGRKFSTKTFWKEVRATGATNIQYVGETLRYLLAAPPEIDLVTGENLDKKHNVKIAFGNGLRPDIWNKFKERFGVETVAEFYTATESTMGIWNVSRNDLAAGAIGRNGWLLRALLSRDVGVVEVDWETEQPWRDPQTGLCKQADLHGVGELLFRIPTDEIEKRFQGYYNNPEATKAKIIRDVFAKGDIWFRTGDVIRWDGTGLFYFSDRIGDTFRWKSENVSTSEVSEVVGLHPSVREANVYGVELPHHDGRAGCIAICFDRPAEPETLQSLASHVRKSLPKFAVPLFLRVVPEVGGGAQTTGTNKQQKHILRQAGVKPGAMQDGSVLYWLKGDSYVPFGDKEWQEIQNGRVKL